MDWDHKTSSLMIVRAFLFLSATGLVGCGKDSTSDAKASATEAKESPDQATLIGSLGAATLPGDSDPLIDAQPFVTIALASDTSYNAPPIPSGTMAGEVRELTALKIRFCWCPAGSFRMGSEENSSGHQLNETQFEVNLSRGFWLQQTEVTQAQYKSLMGINPAFYQGESNPVETVSWTEATEFCRRLSELPPEAICENHYRLPTEAEWEYGCRAGSTTVYGFGDDETRMEDYGWFHKNSARTTHPVGGKQPNAWGLHDMHGNVMEWCSDYFGDYPSGSVIDPKGLDSGSKRSLRGGGWFFVPLYARSAHRDAYVPSAQYIGLGFRLVAEPSPAAQP